MGVVKGLDVIEEREPGRLARRFPKSEKIDWAQADMITRRLREQARRISLDRTPTSPGLGRFASGYYDWCGHDPSISRVTPAVANVYRARADRSAGHPAMSTMGTLKGHLCVTIPCRTIDKGLTEEGSPGAGHYTERIDWADCGSIRSLAFREVAKVQESVVLDILSLHGH